MATYMRSLEEVDFEAHRYYIEIIRKLWVTFNDSKSILDDVVYH